MLSGCQPQKQQITISATYKRQPLHCDSFFDVQGQAWKIDTLRFFISDLAFKVSGQWHNAQLLSDEWQTGEVSLLSLITPDCLSGQLNTQLRFYSDIPWQDVEGVRFVLAVPFAQNHQNPLQQPSPLNLPAMFWSWQLGHKFLRLDMRGEQYGWSFHLGSIGCQSASLVRAPEQPCKQPNRVAFELNTPTSAHLQFDLGSLLEQVSPADMQSCMFQKPNLVSCEQLLDNLHREPLFRWR